MPFKKGQTVILAVIENDKVLSHVEATVSKGGKDNFTLYGSDSTFSQNSGVRRGDIWLNHGKQTSVVFENEAAMHAFIERKNLLNQFAIFFNSGYFSKANTLTNDQLKAILTIINQK